MRICKNCGPQDSNLFRFRIENGIQVARCIKCTREISRRSRERNREVIKQRRAVRAEYRQEYERRRRAEIRTQVLHHYGGEHPKCACCGVDFNEFLCVDHINGGGNKHRTMIGSGGTAFYWWLLKNYLM